jgi:hypothetical protein
MDPDTWHMAMVAALDWYKQALWRWKADPSEACRRDLQLAGAHADHVEAQRPETPSSSSAR